MDTIDRIGTCRGLDESAIAAAFDDLEQGDITRVIVDLFGSRTAIDRLPSLPFSVRHVLYGDEDVSEWRIAYSGSGYSVEEAHDRREGEQQIRWEHWEDGVRLLNGDIAALSLLYARRVVVEDTEFDAPNAAEPPWFRAVNFAITDDVSVHGQVLSDLVEAHRAGGKARSEYVSRVGLERVVNARAFVVAHTLIGAGGVDELEGSFMRMIVPGDPQVCTQVDFAPETGRPSVRNLSAEEADRPDPAGGVTLRYATGDALVAAASGEKTFEQLVVGGEVRLDGSGERLDRFARSLTKLAELYGA